jgi:uncharacterized protein YjiS (DUF1127 family)
MRATSDTARHFGWGPSMAAAERQPGSMAGVTAQAAPLRQAFMPALDGVAAAGYRVRYMVARAAAAIRRWRLINKNIKELYRLDDHLLEDIGLHRSEIVASVHRRVAEIEISGRYRYR